MTRKLTFLLLLSLLPSFALYAEVAKDDHQRVAAMRALAVNRSLLTAAEADYGTALKEDTQNPTDQSARTLENLRYKIQALQEDAARLQEPLPKDLKADAYVNDLVARQVKLGDPKKRVDPTAEKQLDKTVRSIYHLHENALSAIARRDYGEAERLYEEIVMISPDDEEASLLLGHTCILSGNYDKAALAFHNAISLRPENLMDIPRMYQNILVESPSDDETMTQLGYVYLLLGNAAGAQRSFEEAIKLNPGNMEARRGMKELP